MVTLTRVKPAQIDGRTHTPLMSSDLVRTPLLVDMPPTMDTTNAACPVNRLPPEILCDIFQYVITRQCDDPVAASARLSRLDHAATPLAISHVCGYWREVALNTPGLWVNIEFRMHTSAVPSYLTRSRLSPVNLQVELPPNHSVMNAFVTDGPRIRSLHCHSARQDDDDSVFECLKFPAAKLKVLIVDLNHHNYIPFPDTPRPELFGGHTPRLNVLTLRSVPWLPSNRIGTLTHLYISDQFVSSLTNLVDFLSGAPSLQDLVLVQLMRRNMIDVDCPSVHLPHLRRLVIGDVTAAFAAALLSHITLPADIAIRLFDVERGPTCDLSFLRAMPGLALMDGLTTLRLAVGGDTSTIKFSIVAAGSSSALCLDWEVPREFEAAQRRNGWVDALLAFLPVGSIEEVWIDGWKFRCDDLESILQGVPFMKKLVVRDLFHNVEPYICQVLSSRPSSSHVPCPNLLRMRLTEGLTRPDAFAAFVRSRAQCGRRLELLEVDTLPDMHRPETYLTGLEAYVGSVEITRRDAPRAMSMPIVCTEGPQMYWSNT